MTITSHSSATPNPRLKEVQLLSLPNTTRVFQFSKKEEKAPHFGRISLPKQKTKRGANEAYHITRKKCRRNNL